MFKKIAMGTGLAVASTLPALADGPTAPDLTGITTPLVSGAAAVVTAGIAVLVIPWGIRYFKGLLRRFLG